MANTTGKKHGGRKKGIPNKVTKEIREAYKNLIENNIDNLDNWLNEIAKESPARAFDILLKLSEFVLPKLNKQSVDVSEKGIRDNLRDLTDEEIEKEIKRLSKQTQLTIVVDSEETKKNLEDLIAEIKD